MCFPCSLTTRPLRIGGIGTASASTRSSDGLRLFGALVIEIDWTGPVLGAFARDMLLLLHIREPGFDS